MFLRSSLEPYLHLVELGRGPIVAADVEAWRDGR